jgi:hypothetical protein
MARELITPVRRTGRETGILVKGSMRSDAITIASAGLRDPTQMHLAQDNSRRIDPISRSQLRLNTINWCRSTAFSA